jgi:LysR family hydrogen peroxide-inducible transcriptional activator
MQIKKAEETFGHFIFDRSKNPIELTAFGREVLPVIRDILAENDKLKLICDRRNGKVKEEVTLGIIPTVSAYMVRKLFSYWQNSLENVVLNIVEYKTSELLEKIEQNEIDLAILAGPYLDPKLRTVPLFQEEIFVYCPTITEKRISLNQLEQKHPWLLNKGNCLRTQMIHFCQINENNKLDQWNYQGGNIDLLIEMVNANGGYTLVPENYQLNEEQQTHLKRVENLDGFPAREIIGLYHNRSIKKESIEKMLRIAQLQYSKPYSGQKVSILHWK